jgi:Ca2+-binding RTX toxin-like protein
VMRALPGNVAIACLLLAALPAVANAGGPNSPASPSCAAGPVTVGDTTYGTPCSDVIVAPPGVEMVRGGEGDDTIVPAPIAASTCKVEGGGEICHLEVGSQTFEGGPGDDVVFGERGNDTLRGGGGNDRLYGGIGDDLLEGGPGDDLLSGGFGADGIDGGPGNDFVRGDATQDEIADTGPATDVDTLSYSTAVTPGFGNKPGYPNFTAHSGFPAFAAERGVYLDLGALPGENGIPEENGDNAGAPNGGGVDDVAGDDFERIVGSPFSDYIVGSKSGQVIFGGGGADVLISGGSGTSLNGGADGDDCVGGASVSGCESTLSDGPVVPREKAEVSVGAMTPGEGKYAQLYLVGSTGVDEVTLTSTGSSPMETVKVQLAGGSFDQSPSASSGCTTPNATEAVCALTTPLDSVLVAGMGGNDKLLSSGLQATTSLMMLGGDGDDEVTAGDESDDTLVDGPGDDVLRGHGGDDAVVGNGGRDQLFGEGGNDLFLSTAICENDVVNGGEGRDNASWAKFGEGVEARLDQGLAGRPGPAGAVQCGGGTPDSLLGIEDLEGSGSADVFYGDSGPNQLLGHLGPDTYFAAAGKDTILANSADDDPVIDCGDDVDTAVVDRRPKYNDATPVGCETVREADPNSFQIPTQLPATIPVAPTIAEPNPPIPPVGDRTPPQTRIAAHPRAVLFTTRAKRRVAFRFASSEGGSAFRCKLDRKPFRPCASPRAYWLAPGRHTIRIAAVDAAGNADSTPALFGFRIRRR